MNPKLSRLKTTPIAILLIYATALYVLFQTIFNLVWGAFFFDPKTISLSPEKVVEPFYEMGTSLGFWGTVFMCLNFVMATRWRWVERLFSGLDKVYRTHAWVGKIGLIMVLLHFGILLLEAGKDVQLTNSYLIPGTNLSYTLGMASIVLFVLLVIITLWVKVSYQTWLKTHKFLGIPYILGGLHAIVAQGDWYMVLLTAVGGYAWFYSLFLYRRLGDQARGVIQQVISKGEITELIIRLDSARPASPGQFIFFSVHHSAASISAEAHPFSLSKIIDDKTWRISAKKLGDYTNSLSGLLPGDEVLVYGPYGTFGNAIPASFTNQVWVAGGIGITPFLSLLQAKADSRDLLPVHLVWAVRNKADAHYVDEIENLISDHPNINLYLHEGHFSAATLEKFIGKQALIEAAILVCGPSGMLKALRNQLEGYGKPDHHIFSEDFNFR